jgi:hypothetical protein
MSYLLKIVGNSEFKRDLSSDELVGKISKRFKKLLRSASKNNLKDTVIHFYHLTWLVQSVTYNKSVGPKTLEEASSSADVHEYFMETLKEASTVVEVIVKAKFGNLVNRDTVQKMVTFASEIDKITDKAIEKHLLGLMPSPRKETNRKRGK